LDKAPDAFRTISEVAEEINVPQHVLRFWETRFGQIRPLKRGGGRRYYRPDDVDLLRGVRHLLYGEGYTIRGVQRILREEGLAFVQEVWRVDAEPSVEAEEDGVEAAGDESEVGAQEPSFFAVAIEVDEGSSEPARERREPNFAATAPAEQPQRSHIDAENRRKLQAALDDLVACRRLIDAAFAETADLQDRGGEAD